MEFEKEDITKAIIAEFPDYTAEPMVKGNFSELVLTQPPNVDGIQIVVCFVIGDGLTLAKDVFITFRVKHTDQVTKIEKQIDERFRTNISASLSFPKNDIPGMIKLTKKIIHQMSMSSFLVYELLRAGGCND